MSPDCGGVTSGTRASFPTDVRWASIAGIYLSRPENDSPARPQTASNRQRGGRQQAKGWPPTGKGVAANAKGVAAREVSVWCPKNRTRRCRYACR
jgi:hypothetical protein